MFKIIIEWQDVIIIVLVLHDKIIAIKVGVWVKVTHWSINCIGICWLAHIPTGNKDVVIILVRRIVLLLLLF